MKPKPVRLVEIQHRDHFNYATCNPAFAHQPNEITMKFEVYNPVWRPVKDDLVNVAKAILAQTEGFDLPKVTRVIFNGPATILFWDDGEKTVVKCSECGDGRCLMAKDYEREADEPALWRPFFCKIHFDPEKAIMAAMLKRLYPNFQNVLRAWVADEDEADGQ